MLAKMCFHMLEIRETKRVFHALLRFSTIIADLCLGSAPIYFSFRSGNCYNSHFFFHVSTQTTWNFCRRYCCVWLYSKLLHSSPVCGSNLEDNTPTVKYSVNDNSAKTVSMACCYRLGFPALCMSQLWKKKWRSQSGIKLSKMLDVSGFHSCIIALNFSRHDQAEVNPRTQTPDAAGGKKQQQGLLAHTKSGKAQ